MEMFCGHCKHFFLRADGTPPNLEAAIREAFLDEQGEPTEISPRNAVLFMSMNLSGYGSRRCGTYGGSTFGSNTCDHPEEFQLKEEV